MACYFVPIILEMQNIIMQSLSFKTSTEIHNKSKYQFHAN